MNIVLIVVDTLRAKNLPIHGYDKDTAPFLTEMAERHEYAENYYSNSPWTLPAHATMFTGQLPHQHGTTTESLKFKEENLLVQKLKAMGYRTIGISENSILSPELDFDRDFDKFTSTDIDIDGNHYHHFLSQIVGKPWHYRLKKLFWFLWYTIRDQDTTAIMRAIDHLMEKIGVKKRKTEEYNPTNSKRTIKKAQKAIQGEDTFLFLNLMTTHRPYTFNEEEREDFLENAPPEEIQNSEKGSVRKQIENGILTERELRIRERKYDASISYTDKLLEQLWGETGEETVFIVTSDHGELHGEYKRQDIPLIGHAFGTFKELLHTPLIVFPQNKIKLEGSNIYDHRSLHKLILNLAEDAKEKKTGREQTTAEYYSQASLEFNFSRDPPEGYNGLYNRKSFSQITRKWKYDNTSEGNFLWETEKNTEDENLIDQEKDVAEKLREELKDSLNNVDLEGIEV